MTLASKREQPMMTTSFSQEHLKEYTTLSGLSARKSPPKAANAIMVKQPMQSSIRQKTKSSSISPVRDTVQSDSSPTHGAKIPTSTPLINQSNSMSARVINQEVAKRFVNPNFFDRSISSNSESIIDDNMQEGTAANYPI